MTGDQDEFPAVMLKYRCRILFTTRSRYENRISLEVKELPVASLLARKDKFYDAGRKTDILEEMIGLGIPIKTPHRSNFWGAYHLIQMWYSFYAEWIVL